jgi:hypothetical protein
MRAVPVALCLALVALAGCSKSPAAPTTPDLFAHMYGTWIGILKDREPGNSVWMYSDSVRVVVTPGASSPTVQMWQLKLSCDVGGNLIGVSSGATWRAIPFMDCNAVGSPTEGGNVYAHTEPDSIGGTVPGRTVGDYVFWIGPGGEPHGPGATVDWPGSVYSVGDMTLTLE